MPFPPQVRLSIQFVFHAPNGALLPVSGGYASGGAVHVMLGTFEHLGHPDEAAVSVTSAQYPGNKKRPGNTPGCSVADTTGIAVFLTQDPGLICVGIKKPELSFHLLQVM